MQGKYLKIAFAMPCRKLVKIDQSPKQGNPPNIYRTG
jgi:hypothetical protein